VLLDAAGRRRSSATMPGFHAGRPPHSNGRRDRADPPKVEEIVAVMSQTGTAPYGLQMRGLIVVLRVAMPTTDSAAPGCLRGSAPAQRRLPRARRLSRVCARRCGGREALP
jgi:hypothetical protein